MDAYDLLDLLFDAKFLATVAVGILAFATVVTLGVPLLERDSLGRRLKAVAERREELRARHHAALNAKRSGLRNEPVGTTKLITQIVERFNLTRLVQSEGSREKLATAGLRSQTHHIVFMFFRFVMPFILFALALFYLYVVTHFAWSGTMKMATAVGAALLGFYLPDLFVSNLAARRQTSIMNAFPDALDLLLICVESGMSVESAFAKVASEIG